MVNSPLNLITLLLARIAVRRHPKNPELWLRLGLAYERRGLHSPRPLQDRRLGIGEPLPNPIVHYGAAQTPDSLDEAISAYRRAISLNSGFAQAWVHLAVAYTLRYRRGSFFGDDRLQEGLSEDKREGLEIAADAYQRAIQIEPENAPAWNDLGFVYGQLDRLDDEVNAYRQAARIQPDYVAVWHNLTTVYYNRRQVDNVAEVCQEAVKHIPLDAHSWYDLGWACEQLGRLEDATNAYKEAWRLKPEFPGPWVNLGVVYAKLGRVDDALSVYCKVIESKSNEKATFHLARFDLEQSEQGRAVLRRLATLYPRFMAKQGGRY